jgi:hypothetical protein
MEQGRTSSNGHIYPAPKGAPNGFPRQSGVVRAISQSARSSVPEIDLAIELKRHAADFLSQFEKASPSRRLRDPAG